jgi:hypothetical protein
MAEYDVAVSKVRVKPDLGMTWQQAIGEASRIRTERSNKQGGFK